MDPEFDFFSFFRARIAERNINLERLSQMSGIIPKHLRAIEAGDIKNLPSAPYMRGYLIRLGQILDFDGEEWWLRIKRHRVSHASGAQDSLPRNRFAIKRRTKLLFAGLTAVFVAGILLFRFASIIGKPDLVVVNPSVESTTVKEESLTLEGRISGGDRVSINGEPVIVGDDGVWQKKVLLQQGLNTFEIIGSKTLGREQRTVRQIIYEGGSQKDISLESGASSTASSTGEGVDAPSEKKETSTASTTDRRTR